MNFRPAITGPTYGLGSGARIRSAILISSPRTKIGSVGRVYSYLKAHNNSFYAMNFVQKSVYGPFIIENGRLVYN